MEHILYFNNSRPGAGAALIRRIRLRAMCALRRGLLAGLQLALGAFLVGYPLLRLGFLGPVPEGHAIETASGMVVGAIAAVLFLLEGGK